MRRLVAVAVWALVAVTLLAACSGPAHVITTPVSSMPGVGPSEDEVREQIHAATGHDPENCTSMMGDTASIQIDDTVTMPLCIIIQEDAELIVSNQTDVYKRFAVSDPPGINGRHDIYVLKLPVGAEDAIPTVGERTQSGIYPFYIRGGEPFSGFLVVVP